MPQNASNPQGKPQPKTDEERRKQANERRPMIMRRMLVFNMDEKIDLDALLRKQLGGIPKDFYHAEEPSNGRTGIEEDGRHRN